jgi:CRP-like cAMP-binding protein
VLDHVPLTATARAVTPCRLVALDVPRLLALCECHPRLGFTLMRRMVGVLAKRLGATRTQLFEAYRAGLPVVAGIHEGSD